MYKIQFLDRTKTEQVALYYMETTEKLMELWQSHEETEELAENLRYALRGEKRADLGLSPEEYPLVSEVKLAIGAKQDFHMEKSWLQLHNTKGQECNYYVASLLLKIRWASEDGSYVKLGSFVAQGIAAEDSYGEGGLEQVTCCGNPVLEHYSSSIVPAVSDFEEDFKQEKITMLGYKLLKRFETVEEVNADIAKKEIAPEEAELLLRDIPGELG